jgi:hypothetical protein
MFYGSNFFLSPNPNHIPKLMILSHQHPSDNKLYQGEGCSSDEGKAIDISCKQAKSSAMLSII